MTVKDGRLTLPDGMSYRLLVLPTVQTITPRLLGKIKELVDAGATVIGPRPLRSPSLADYPNCDGEVKRLADELWGKDQPSAPIEERSLRQGATWSACHASMRRPSAFLFGPNPLRKAKWIWLREGNPAAAALVGDAVFPPHDRHRTGPDRSLGPGHDDGRQRLRVVGQRPKRLAAETTSDRWHDGHRPAYSAGQKSAGHLRG